MTPQPGVPFALTWELPPQSGPFLDTCDVELRLLRPGGSEAERLRALETTCRSSGNGFGVLATSAHTSTGGTWTIEL